jgi:hypothetical protein
MPPPAVTVTAVAGSFIVATANPGKTLNVTALPPAGIAADKVGMIVAAGYVFALTRTPITVSDCPMAYPWSAVYVMRTMFGAPTGTAAVQVPAAAHVPVMAKAGKPVTAVP